MNKSGDTISELVYDEEVVKFVQLWISSGKPCLTNGTGKYEKYLKTQDAEKVVRIFKDSLEVESYTVRELKNDTLYYKTDTKAHPKDGLKSFYNDLAKNIDYPKISRLLGIEKKITIQFVVDEEGNLTDFVPLNDKSFNFEKKTIKRLEKMPRWIPATLNGKNVKTKFSIPLTFKMEP